MERWNQTEVCKSKWRTADVSTAAVCRWNVPEWLQDYSGIEA